MAISHCPDMSLDGEDLFPVLVNPGPLTLERIKSFCKGSSLTRQALHGQIDCRYTIAKKDGMTEEEAVQHTLDKMIAYFDSKINKRRIP